MTVAGKLTEITTVWATAAAAISGLTWTLVRYLRRALR